ncbi:hypothetical protein KY366_00985 [Candidatus Woesearchaeota archaeon]|nr:hypothetical protein [Candidatus Woesearchaeota archaeon]
MKKTCSSFRISVVIAAIFLVIAIISSFNAVAVPSGPSVNTIKNETATPASAALVNTSGGSITTMVLNSTTQNLRWKAYVGNVTGTLVLDDASGYSVFDWSVATLVGEVYATRSSSTVTWSDIACATPSDITDEEIALDHTSNPNDNISTTFSTQDHNSFYVGSEEITEDSCYSVHTYVDDSSQSTDFEEVLLYDQSYMVYATIIENDVMGYRPDQTYDFQMILPEVGLSSWTSSTPYYFYVELI